MFCRYALSRRCCALFADISPSFRPYAKSVICLRPYTRTMPFTFRCRDIAFHVVFAPFAVAYMPDFASLCRLCYGVPERVVFDARKESRRMRRPVDARPRFDARHDAQHIAMRCVTGLSPWRQRCHKVCRASDKILLMLFVGMISRRARGSPPVLTPCSLYHPRSCRAHEFFMFAFLFMHCCYAIFRCRCAYEARHWCLLNDALLVRAAAALDMPVYVSLMARRLAALCYLCYCRCYDEARYCWCLRRSRGAASVSCYYVLRCSICLLPVSRDDIAAAAEIVDCCLCDDAMLMRRDERAFCFDFFDMRLSSPWCVARMPPQTRR